MTAEQPPLDIDRLLATLHRHDVDFVLVGGMAAIAHGALRPTADLDCLARRSAENLARLAAAMRELNARLRVAGLTDAEATALPTPLDADALGRMQISTWRTDAGDFDVLTEIAARDGRRLRYDELAGRASVLDIHGVVVRVAALEDLIASKDWADRPKDRDALPELRELATAGEGNPAIRADAPRADGAAANERPPSPPRSEGPIDR